MKTLALLAPILLLSACAQPEIHKYDSPYYKIPVGSSLILNQDIAIPAGQARALIQYGKMVTERNQIDQYYPWCEFEVRTLKDEERVIQPDHFRITRLSKEFRFSSRSVMYASLVSNDYARLIGYATVMYLQSEKQPDVYRMTCLYWTDDNMDEHLSKNQISDTLGQVFSLEIAQ
jgi:hypothetical protein